MSSGARDGNDAAHTVRHPGAVAIIATDAQKRVLLIKQFRPAANETLLEIPRNNLKKAKRRWRAPSAN